KVMLLRRRLILADLAPIAVDLILFDELPELILPETINAICSPVSGLRGDDLRVRRRPNLDGETRITPRCAFAGALRVDYGDRMLRKMLRKPPRCSQPCVARTDNRPIERHASFDTPYIFTRRQ